MRFKHFRIFAVWELWKLCNPPKCWKSQVRKASVMINPQLFQVLNPLTLRQTMEPDDNFFSVISSFWQGKTNAEEYKSPMDHASGQSRLALCPYNVHTIVTGNFTCKTSTIVSSCLCFSATFTAHCLCLLMARKLKSLFV